MECNIHLPFGEVSIFQYEKIDSNRNFDVKMIYHKLPIFSGFPSKLRDLSPCTVQ